MKKKKERKVRKSVSYWPHIDAFVTKKSKSMGYSFSLFVNHIIADWMTKNGHDK